eukprot:14142710-Alexandrium_andersonii.AAC.1
MKDERNAFRKLRTSAERDLNLARSRIAAHEAQTNELVTQHASEHQHYQARLATLEAENDRLRRAPTEARNMAEGEL